MSEYQFITCQKANEQFCILNTPLLPLVNPQTCVSALYAKDKDSIQKICSLQIKKAHILGPAPDTAMSTGTGKVVPGKNHISADTVVQVITIYIEAIPGHDIGIIATTPEVAHDASVPHTKIIAIDPIVTHYIDPTTDHPSTEAHHHTTPQTEVTHIHVHPTNPQDETHIGHTHTPVDHETHHITRTPEQK